MNSNSVLLKISGWLVTIMTPLVILMVSVRLLVTPLFAQMEYRMPWFPDDPYGFTLEDRLRWSEPSINYLVNAKDISFLESLRFDAGEPILNARELSHMIDVKSVVSLMRIVLTGMMLIILAMSIAAVRRGWKPLFLNAIRRGGYVIIGIIGLVLSFVVISFNDLFTWFHQLFFESGTWQFHPSDTLIRLFPMIFWRDAFILVGLMSVIMGAAIILVIDSEKPSKSNND